MDFLRTAIKTAQDVQKSVQVVSRELQVAKQRQRSASNERPIKINVQGLEKVDGSGGFGVYRDPAKLHVVWLETLESVYRTSQAADAHAVQLQLNQHVELVRRAVPRGKLADLCSTIRLHADWADVHLASFLGFEEFVAQELAKKEPVVVLSRATPLEGRFPVQLAAERRHIPLMVNMVKAGADICKQDLAGRNAVHMAALHDAAVVKALKVRDKKGFTPLGYAMQTDHRDTIEFLVACGAVPEPDMILNAGMSAIGLDTILTLKPKAFASNSNKNMLHTSVDKKYLKVLHQRSPHLLNQTDEAGRTPLHAAVLRNDLQGLMQLVAHGADVQMQDQEGNTPLHLAVLADNVPMVKFLVAVDGGVAIKNKDDKIPGQMSSKAELVRMFQRIGQAFKKSKGEPGLDLPELIRTAQANAVAHQVQQEAAVRDRSLRLLSLDGGGIRGIGLIMTLIHIDKSIANGDLMDYVDWIAGTSTGAILALALAEGASLNDCLGLYLRLKDDIFAGVRPHDPQPLEAALQEQYGEQKTLAQLGGKKRVLVAVTKADVHPPELLLLRNYELAAAARAPRPADVLAWRAARCSSAAPTYFSSVDNVYVDGGLMANNPSMDLLNDVHLASLEKSANDEEPEPAALLISVGTGRLRPRPISSLDLELPKSFSWSGLLNTALHSANTLNNLKNMFVEQLAASDGAVVERARSWCHSQKTAFFRYTPELDKDCALNTTDNLAIVDFMWSQKLYLLSRSDQEIKDIVRLLRAN